jgi:hypothetical protein
MLPKASGIYHDGAKHTKDDLIALLRVLRAFVLKNPSDHLKSGLTTTHDQSSMPQPDLLNLHALIRGLSACSPVQPQIIHQDGSD